MADITQHLWETADEMRETRPVTAMLLDQAADTIETLRRELVEARAETERRVAAVRPCD